MVKNLFNPQEIIPAFDRHLVKYGLSFEAVAIGGAALSILGIIDRGTRDLDLIGTEIPKPIQKAALEFAQLHALAGDWLNTGPESLARDLPTGWRTRTQVLYAGAALKLSTLARFDLILSKLWAMCDRMRDLDDLIALAPNDEELGQAATWVKRLDANPDWPARVDTNLAVLRGRLGRG
jgi:hypothetical protein